MQIWAWLAVRPRWSDAAVGRPITNFVEPDNDPEQSVVQVPVGTETGAGPVEQGEKRENTGSMRPMNNADRRDSAAVECIGTCTTGR